MKSRVCITGIGVASRLGVGVDAFWKGLLSGDSTLQNELPFPLEGCRCRRNAICDPQHVRDRLARFRPELLHRLPDDVSHGTLYGLAAAAEALEMAGIAPGPAGPRTGMVLGTTSGGSFDDFAGGRGIDPALSAPHSTLVTLARLLEIEGPLAQICTACTSSALAIMHAASMIREGRADLVLCGGADHARPADFAGFNALRAMSPRACRPFDAARDGMIIGDGAAFLVLESENSARKRGAEILARLDGAASAVDAFHATRSSPEGLALAVRHALAKSGRRPRDVAYVNAHGTGTPHNDKTEAAALLRVFTDERRPLLSSTKGATGHLLGTAAALEAVIAVLVLRHGTIPPMTGTTCPEEALGFPLADSRAERLRGDVVMSTTLGFGGSNAALVFSRVPREKSHAA